MKIRSCYFAILLAFFFSVFNPIHAQECSADDISKKNLSALSDINQKCNEALSNMEKAVQPHIEELTRMDNAIAAFQARIKLVEADVVKKSAGIAAGEKELGGFLNIASRRIRQFYIHNTINTPLTSFFSQTNVGAMIRAVFYEQVVTNEDKKSIAQTAVSVKDLEDKKKILEEEKSTLAVLKTDIDRRAALVRKLVQEAEAYEAKLRGIIAALTAKQQEILSEKSGTFQTTVGDVPLADDPASRPDYNPGFSPAFAAFSFGAPHFKGMSQYGAFGRAKNGQGAEEILKAYYGSGIEVKKDYSTDITIRVDGYGTYNIEEYAKRIYEMPGSWGDEGGMEALKVQAVAARSYALARTNNGAGSICATEACQVFKSAPKGGKWDEAVNATRGWVLIAGGQPFSAWYASTSGGYQESYSYNGYSTPGFWDTTSSKEKWADGAWEVKGGSPWFYKGWYKSRSGDSCGRSHPWLTSEEMADILNGWVVLFQGGGDSGRVTPQGSCWGGNPYSTSELQTIGRYTSVSGASVTYSDSGVTANVTFQTNNGSITIKGGDFYKAFNLRAPGRIALKSGLFNIEKK